MWTPFDPRAVLTEHPPLTKAQKETLKRVLRESQLLGGVGDDVLDHLLAVGVPYTLPKGATLFHEGDEGTAMYVMLSGRLRIYTTVDGIEQLIAMRRRYDFVGEMSLIEQQPRTASGTAVTECRVFCIGGEDFRELLCTQPTLALAVISTVSQRARAALAREKALAHDVHMSNLALQRANRNLERRVEAKTRELREANAQLRAMTLRDGLTGAQNRRSFDETIGPMIAECLRDDRPFSMLMIDIDHFKQVNDVHGHQAGDRVLTQVAQIAQSLLHPGQVLARYGGEEFAVLLPRVTKATAVEKAEQIRLAVMRHTFPIRSGQPGDVHISLGVATCPEDARTPATIIEAADRCLYKAKESGRNQVVAV